MTRLRQRYAQRGPLKVRSLCSVTVMDPSKVLRWALCVLSFLLLWPMLARGASVAVSPLSAAKAYPNPWRSDKHTNVSIRFDGLPAASTVKLFTVSGHEVKSLSADSRGTASWDRTNDSGDTVASGVYIYLIIDPQGNEKSGKIAIIK